MYSANMIAKWILVRNKREIAFEGGEFITNLKLQKLLYYTQGSYMALKDQPLFEEDFEAWTYGPVIPEIYQIYKENGSRGIDTSEMSFDGTISPDDLNILEEVYDVFGQYSASKLVKMTHEETPWKNAYSPYFNNIIEKSAILKYFKENYVE